MNGQNALMPTTSLEDWFFNLQDLWVPALGEEIQAEKNNPYMQKFRTQAVVRLRFLSPAWYTHILRLTSHSAAQGLIYIRALGRCATKKEL